MKIGSLIIVLLFFLVPPTLSAQYESLDTLGYISPVTHPLRLTGNFGELRSNHFHSGIDIKSKNGAVGDPIICVQDGWVSRIKIQLSGYGHALYIDHPDGYTSVYAHLDEFSPKLEKFVKEKQQLLQSYRLDLYLDNDQLRFTKGDTIAFMGNSGRSTGPHLHFEIRETESEEPINPFHFGIKIPDDIRPTLESLKIYGLDKNLVPINEKSIKANQIKRYEIDAWRVGIGMKVHDIINGTWNKNGIYKFELFLDDSLHFAGAFDQFGFHQTRFINACIDYKTKMTAGVRYLLLYNQPGNELDFFRTNKHNGIIKIYKDQPRKVNVKIFDFDGNKDEYTFELVRKENVTPLKKLDHQYYLTSAKSHELKTDKLSVNLPKGSLYTDTFFDLSMKEDEEEINFSIGDKKIPCHKYYEIKLDISSFPDSIKHALCLIYLDQSRMKSIGGKIMGDSLVCQTNKFGRFKTGVDLNEPVIKLLSSLDDIQPGQKINVRLYDQLQTIGLARDIDWDVFIDDDWVLAPYDLKSKRASFIIPWHIEVGMHKLRIVATDDRGNTNHYESEFHIMKSQSD